MLDNAIDSETALTIYDPKFAAKQILSDGKTTETALKSLVPMDIPNTFKPSSTIEDGYKYIFNVNDTKMQVKWHFPDLDAKIKYPGCNSGDGWTAQVKIGNRYLNQAGDFVKRTDNSTHIPIN